MKKRPVKLIIRTRGVWEVYMGKLQMGYVLDIRRLKETTKIGARQEEEYTQTSMRMGTQIPTYMHMDLRTHARPTESCNI